MKKAAKRITLSSAAAGVFWLLASNQQKQSAYGAYLSIVSSCRAAMIVYQSYHDYQQSLNHIPYNTQQYHQTRHQVHLRVAKRILQLSKDNRGIYLKLGQYLGNLERVVPWQFTQVLKVLQDSAPPIDYEEMKVIFESDLHKQSSEIFSYIDQTPIASASLAQVHKGKLANTNEEVAIKLQYPFLRIQSSWDLLMLKQVTKICNYLAKRWKDNDIDFIKLYNEWTSTLVEELDFNIQLQHALKTKQLFSGNDKIYIPKYYPQLCSDRLIVMEFVQGIKVSQKDQMIKQGINPKLVGKNLIDIFTSMIFQHGFVHCDAHPGNFLIRPKNNSVGHQIVLLDHGLYRSLQPETIRNFSGLFVSLMQQQRQKVHDYALNLNIQDHFQYLPLIFLHRSRNSKKKIGDNITEEQKIEFRQKDLSNFDSINRILQDLPPQLMYIIRASNLIASHNINLGGSNRDRIFLFTQRSLKVLYPQWIHFQFNYISLLMKVWLFQTFPLLYRWIFGTLQN